eukprot:CAMPEP_0177651204 /NCGR_PEP_ID=MMETSP0447-20121125/12402_1 /TAXON_ID=0 /ORGANISM="Stygamoeba regulata, Strain BSH-02190019" /LENGTH=954 /DNA_ID=CAMNT_0019154227 /DNA_START=43 /DNA_END=2904 /DNA_ORIENTATION=-
MTTTTTTMNSSSTLPHYAHAYRLGFSTHTEPVNDSPKKPSHTPSSQVTSSTHSQPSLHVNSTNTSPSSPTSSSASSSASSSVSLRQSTSQRLGGWGGFMGLETGVSLDGMPSFASFVTGHLTRSPATAGGDEYFAVGLVRTRLNQTTQHSDCGPLTGERASALLAQLSALSRPDTKTGVISERKYQTLFEAARGSDKSLSTVVRRRYELDQFVSSVANFFEAVPKQFAALFHTRWKHTRKLTTSDEIAHWIDLMNDFETLTLSFPFANQQPSKKHTVVKLVWRVRNCAPENKMFQIDSDTTAEQLAQKVALKCNVDTSSLSIVEVPASAKDRPRNLVSKEKVLTLWEWGNAKLAVVYEGQYSHLSVVDIRSNTETGSAGDELLTRLKQTIGRVLEFRKFLRLRCNDDMDGVLVGRGLAMHLLAPYTYLQDVCNMLMVCRQCGLDDSLHASRRAGLKEAVSLDAAKRRFARLAALIHKKVRFRDRRVFLSTYNNCAMGSEIVDFLVRDRVDNVQTREEAVLLGRLLQKKSLLVSVQEQSKVFKDSQALFRIQLPDDESSSSSSSSTFSTASSSSSASNSSSSSSSASSSFPSSSSSSSSTSSSSGSKKKKGNYFHRHQKGTHDSGGSGSGHGGSGGSGGSGSGSGGGGGGSRDGGGGNNLTLMTTYEPNSALADEPLQPWAQRTPLLCLGGVGGDFPASSALRDRIVLWSRQLSEAGAAHREEIVSELHQLAQLLRAERRLEADWRAMPHASPGQLVVAVLPVFRHCASALSCLTYARLVTIEKGGLVLAVSPDDADHHLVSWKQVVPPPQEALEAMRSHDERALRNVVEQAGGLYASEDQSRLSSSAQQSGAHTARNQLGDLRFMGSSMDLLTLKAVDKSRQRSQTSAWCSALVTASADDRMRSISAGSSETVSGITSAGAGGAAAAAAGDAGSAGVGAVSSISDSTSATTGPT